MYWKQKIIFCLISGVRYSTSLRNDVFQSFLKPGSFSSYEGDLALGPPSGPVAWGSRGPGEEAGKWTSFLGPWKLLETGGDLPSFSSRPQAGHKTECRVGRGLLALWNRTPELQLPRCAGQRQVAIPAHPSGLWEMNSLRADQALPWAQIRNFILVILQLKTKWVIQIIACFNASGKLLLSASVHQKTRP